MLLIIPLLTMGSDEQASSDPAGEVFDLMEDINDRFAPRVHGAGYIVESRTEDILTQVALWELYQNEQSLREEDQKGGLAPEGLASQTYLYESFDIETNRPFLGVYSLADAVADVMMNDPRFSTTLETATDEQVKLAVHQLFSNPDTSGLKESLSVKAQKEKRVVSGNEIDYWTSPALIFSVLADNEKLGGGILEVGVGGGETVQNKEEFNRNVQRILRGDELNFNLWGIAIDVNLEASSEGQTAGLFIMFTVVAVVLVAGLSLRSYWAVALTGAGLGTLMIWLKGISNLVGLKEGLVIDLIVPIAMISLGVDFALHSLRRYREEKGRGFAPGMALRASFVGVLGALALAMVSDSIAFLSNTLSGIEAVIQFGIAAAIAMVSSFIILGVVLPLALMRIDQLRHPTPTSPSRRARLMTLWNSVGVAALTGTGVIFLVAVSKPLGVAVLLATVVGYLVVPLLVMHRRRSRRTPVPASVQPETSMPPLIVPSGWFVTLVAGIARYPLVVLLVIVGITTVAVLFATRLEATFDVKDFFVSKSDFVVSLDKLDEHVGERGGEPGIVYIKGDLTDPGALAAIAQFVLDLDDNPDIARQADGDVQISNTVASLLRRLTGSDYSLSRVAAVTGVQVADTDGDGLPDSQAQVEAVYAYMLTEGVPLDENTLVYTPGQVREILFHDPDGIQDDVTILMVEIPGTREQQNVIAARDSLTDNLRVLSESPTITRVGLTGSPFTRLVQLDATAKTLQRSLPIAAAATLVLLLVVMRSLRYAVVTIIPIGLVVAWLYGLMYLTGFALNYVTATIGAVSIGVGIDYSIHMTERFREEMRRASDKMAALRQAANGTGVALLASAASSIVGFTIMGFAPMPMFSSYGILTALMIFLALLASLVVLPSLLLLVTPEKAMENTSRFHRSKGS
ncbi:MAG: efflux RND transporter permease subunit [Candidatus Hydrothermarchaeales archaeon]